MELVGKWTVEQKDNLEGCMNALGLPDVLQRLAPNLGLQLEITKAGDTYTVKQTALLPLHEIKCKSGQEFETTSWQGLPLKGVVSVVGNKMEENYHEGDVSSRTTTQNVGGKLVRTREFRNSKCTLTYTKQ